MGWGPSDIPTVIAEISAVDAPEVLRTLESNAGQISFAEVQSSKVREAIDKELGVYSWRSNRLFVTSNALDGVAYCVYGETTEGEQMLLFFLVRI